MLASTDPGPGDGRLTSAYLDAKRYDGRSMSIRTETTSISPASAATRSTTHAPRTGVGRLRPTEYMVVLSQRPGTPGCSTGSSTTTTTRCGGSGHECDWELVQVGLDWNTCDPAPVTFSRDGHPGSWDPGEPIASGVRTGVARSHTSRTIHTPITLSRARSVRPHATYAEVDV